MHWVIGVLLGVCSLAWSATPVFRIAPHLFQLGDGGLGLAWAHEEEDGAISDIHFQQGDLSTTLTPYGDSSLRWVALPWVPHSKQIATYWIAGMKTKAPIERLPAPGENTSLRFVFLSDSHSDTTGELSQTFAQKAAQFGGNFALHGGDLVETAELPEDWKLFWNAASPWLTNRPLIATVGNHDYGGGEYRRQLQQSPGQVFRRLHTGPLQLILLNSNFEEDPTLLGRELPRLEAWLREPVRWRVVVMHHPPYTATKLSRKTSLDKPEKPAITVVRERLVPLFARHKVDLVLGGDAHVFQRSRHGCTEYLVAGPSGGLVKSEPARLKTHPLSTTTEPASTITYFRVTPKKLVATTRTVTGELLDSLELSKP